MSTEKGDQVSKATRTNDASYLVIIYYAGPPLSILVSSVVRLTSLR